MISNLRKHMAGSWASLYSLVLQAECVRLMKKAEKFLQSNSLWKHWDFGQSIYVESICFRKKMKVEIPEIWSLSFRSHPMVLQSSGSLGASHPQPLGELYSRRGCISWKVAQLFAKMCRITLLLRIGWVSVSGDSDGVRCILVLSVRKV